MPAMRCLIREQAMAAWARDPAVPQQVAEIFIPALLVQQTSGGQMNVDSSPAWGRSRYGRGDLDASIHDPSPLLPHEPSLQPRPVEALIHLP
jgi:hypothetical protein